MFGCRFLDGLKKIGEKSKKRNRLVAQIYAYEGAAKIGTKVPTMK